MDKIIPEPIGGAHRNIYETVLNVKEYIIKTIKELKLLPIDTLLKNRYQKLRFIGANSVINGSR